MSINLEKATEEVRINLTKRGITNIPNDINVSLLLDYSGSMSFNYNNGNVSKILKRLLSIANTIDDDGKLELVLFESRAHYYRNIKIDEFDSTDNIIKDICSKYSMGGTAFAPPLNKILELLPTESNNSGLLKSLFSKNSSKVKGKQLFVLISDGENSDKSEFEKVIKKIESMPNVYVQCVAIGYDSHYLQNLADKSDSVGYSSVSDFTKTNDELIESIINPELIQKFSQI